MQTERNNFTVYKSSAGSGKTWILVFEYLRIVLKKPIRFRSILAVTFTNKAANEMKERIIKRLRELSLPDRYPDKSTEEVLLPALTEATGLTTDELRAAAAEAITLILHHYSDFAVCTIDSFVHRIIRTFAHDLKLSQDFNVEMDTDTIIAQVSSILISKAGTDNALTSVMVEFTESLIADERNWDIEKDITDFAKNLLKEDVQEHIPVLARLQADDFIRVNSILSEFCKKYIEELANVATDALELVRKNGLEKGHFAGGRNGIIGWFEYLQNKRTDHLQPNATTCKYVEEGRWFAGKAGKEEKAAIESILPELIEAWNKLILINEEKNELYIIYSGLARSIFQMALVNEAGRILEDIRHEANILLISDFNRKISEVILNEPVPFIYERTGERYQHILVDEFQDTSVLQWRNILPLIENALSGGNFNLVVGDGKQAIYRFRDGEVEQFARLPELIGVKTQVDEDREQALIRSFWLEELDVNYRSGREIVDFNNGLFSFIASNTNERIATIYEGVKQSVPADHDGGYVCLDLAGNTADNDDENNESAISQKVQKRIQECLNDAYGYSDIAVLCRSNSTGSAIAAYLLGESIPVISSESLMLGSSEAVTIIIAFLNMLAFPDDGRPRIQIAEFLLRRDILKGDAEEIFENAAGKKLYAFERMLGSCIVIRSFNSLRFLSLYDACEEIIRSFQFTGNDPYISFFLDAVLEYTRTTDSGLQEFIEWWNKTGNKKSIKVPEGANAVRIMTVHKAKGLQFPVVIYPVAGEAVKKTKTVLWTEYNDDILSGLNSIMLPLNKELQETRYGPLFDEEMEKSHLDLVNILYVAMTRPEKRLYVITSKPPKESPGLHSVCGILASYLVYLGVWSSEKSVYTFGEPEISQNSDETSSLPDLTCVVSGDWRKKCLLSLTAAGSEKGKDEARERGERIHRVLEIIHDEDGIATAISKAVSLGWISIMEAEELNADLDALVKHPEVRPFFKKGLIVKTEKEIMTADGKIYRPDRILIDGDSAVVIDFKTGKESDKHQEQVKLYIDLLLQMGISKVEGRIIYIFPDIIVRRVIRET